MTTLLEKVSIMQAFSRGEAIEVKLPGRDVWGDLSNPSWNWKDQKYRIKQPEPDSIDWSVFHPSFRWMSRDSDGLVFLRTSKPTLGVRHWITSQGGRVFGIGNYDDAVAIASYKRGDTDWKDSLIERPDVGK